MTDPPAAVKVDSAAAIFWSFVGITAAAVVIRPGPPGRAGH
jgi:hypothetical protein